MFALLYLAIAVAAVVVVRETLPRGASGDEVYYMAQAEFARRHGLLTALSEGDAVLYQGFVLLLNAFGMDLLLAGRLVSVLAAALILPTVWFVSAKGLNLDAVWRHLAVVASAALLVGTGYWRTAGTDTLFMLLLTWALYFIWRESEGETDLKVSIMAGALLAATMLVRPLTLLYLPGILLAMLVSGIARSPVVRERKWWIGKSAVIGGFAAFALLSQLPSLVQKGRLSLESKEPAVWGRLKGPEHPTFRYHGHLTWVQRNTLSLLRTEEGRLPRGHHVSWGEAGEYIRQQGADSLPRGAVDRWLWNPAFTLKLAAESLVTGQLYVFVRRLGLLFPLAIGSLVLVLLRRWRDRPEWRSVLFFGTVVVSYLLIYAAVTLTMTEARLVALPAIILVLLGSRAMRAVYTWKPAVGAVTLLLQCAFILACLALDIRHSL